MQSRQGMRVGRAKFHAGDVDLAIHIWTKALESAYAAQDYAAIYVLSKNLGDAFARLTADQQQQKKHSTAAIKSLQKSIDYYKYALNVIDECALREVLSDASHLVLNRSAGYVHATLQRLQAKMEKLQKLPPAIEEQPCTTCEELFESLVRDESDGCLYCQVCYDAFYASGENVEQESSTASQVSLLSAEGTSAAHERDIAEFSTLDSLETTEDGEGAIADASEELAEASISGETIEDAEKAVSEPSPPALTVVSGTATATEAMEKPVEATEKKCSSEESTQNPVQGKQVYTISELQLLRMQTPVGLCPGAILSSPVAVRGDSSSNASAKLWDRKSSSSKQSKSSSTKTRKSQTRNPIPEIQNSPHLFALPPVELCNTLRDVAAKAAARKSDSGSFMSLTGTQEMAAALFDSKHERAQHAQGDDGDGAPSASNRGSFASDLAHFASIRT